MNMAAWRDGCVVCMARAMRAVRTVPVTMVMASMALPVFCRLGISGNFGAAGNMMVVGVFQAEHSRPNGARNQIEPKCSDEHEACALKPVGCSQHVFSDKTQNEREKSDRQYGCHSLGSR